MLAFAPVLAIKPEKNPFYSSKIKKRLFTDSKDTKLKSYLKCYGG